MKVKIIKTGKSVTVKNNYGMRLIEQGKAVIASDAKKPVKKVAAMVGDA